MKHLFSKFALLAVMAAGLPAIGARAQSTQVVLHTADGQEHAFELSDSPVLQFGQEGLTVKVGGDDKFTSLFGDLKRIDFRMKTTSVKPTELGRAQLSLATDGSTLTVHGWNHSQVSDLNVYSISGACVRHIARWSGQSISVSDLQAGVYVVKINGLTAKFVKQ